MKIGAASNPLPIRLDAETRNRIIVAAKRLGIHRSDVIKLALINQLAEIESGYIKIRARAETVVPS
jgi:antitoxin component of RelBE/YafQ-DinJ toxin-antitoxin module